jgi:hypothetical protein
MARTTIRLPESIGILTKASSTTVSLTQSVLHIGGFQHRTSQSMSLSVSVVGAGGLDASVVAQKLYYVYAVETGGNASLIASRNSNLPSGYAQAKLVGHFFTDQSSQIHTVWAAGEYDRDVIDISTSNRPNALINSDMRYAQYNPSGVQFTNTRRSRFPVDRWICFRGGDFLGMYGNRVSTFGGVPGIQNCLRISRGVGDANSTAAFVCQNVETLYAIPWAGKLVTLSFWAKKGAGFTSTNGGIYAAINVGTGTDESVRVGYTGYQQLVGGVTAITDTWTRYSYTMAIPSNVTEFSPIFEWTSANATGAANEFYEITGIMLNEGPVAAQFTLHAGNHASELAACQRYFEKSYDVDTAPGTATNEGCYVGTNIGSGVFRAKIQYKVTKRTSTAGFAQIYDPQTGTEGSSRNESGNNTTTIQASGESNDSAFAAGDSNNTAQSVWRFQWIAEHEII